jgi:ppGpp synthetase/RelA/SpoT-type nucleotidyltranferase
MKIEKNYTKGDVNRAGMKLLDSTCPEYVEMKEILDNWRAYHVAPLNSFQISLRKKLKTIDNSALISQRLKRTPSIISKLERNPQMLLARMQDIGGIRAVTKNMQNVRAIESAYKKGTRVFSVVQGGKDYIITPKETGYRGIHLIFKCKNGFSIELQVRTQIQHAWATAVETMGTFLSHSLKSSEGPPEWLEFFALAGSAFAVLEGTPRIPGYDNLTDRATFEKLLEIEKRLGVINKLAGFRVVARHISNDKKNGQYHLVTLNLDQMRANIQSYLAKDIGIANAEYSKKEAEISSGKNMQVVLVSSESIIGLKKAYPSYFLDAELFAKQIAVIRKQLAKIKG